MHFPYYKSHHFRSPFPLRYCSPPTCALEDFLIRSPPPPFPLFERLSSLFTHMIFGGKGEGKVEDCIPHKNCVAGTFLTLSCKKTTKIFLNKCFFLTHLYLSFSAAFISLSHGKPSSVGSPRRRHSASLLLFNLSPSLARQETLLLLFPFGKKTKFGGKERCFSFTFLGREKGKK